ncbi:MAG TPA: hypothetical protein PK014_14915 [Thermoanaerobaculia bacterium]|nr:hypothetical protein [Thermoanaerobaculia bacterium]HXK69672.1 hypothetical protein [Thermoanaerobaculia bacterium]
MDQYKKMFLTLSFLLLAGNPILHSNLTLTEVQSILDGQDLDAQFKLLSNLSDYPVYYEDFQNAPGSELPDEIQKCIIEHYIRLYNKTSQTESSHLPWWNAVKNMINPNRKKRINQAWELLIMEAHLIRRFHQPEYADRLVLIHTWLVPPETYGEVAVKSLVKQAEKIMDGDKSQQDSFNDQVQRIMQLQKEGLLNISDQDLAYLKSFLRSKSEERN